MNLEEIKARAEAATEDWTQRGQGSAASEICAVVVPALIAEVERLQEENEAYGHRVGCLRYSAKGDMQRQTELLEKLAAIRTAAERVIFTEENDTAKHAEAIRALAEVIKELK